MKYFHLILILFVFAVSVSLLLFFYFKMRKDYLFKSAAKKIFEKQKSLNQKTFFSSHLLYEIIDAVLSVFPSKKVLNALLKGNFDTVSAYLKKQKQPILSSGLKALFYPTKYIKTFEKFYLQSPKNPLVCEILASLYLVCEQDEQLKDVHENLNLSLGLRDYFDGLSFLQEGDLLSASSNANNAVRLFRKKHFFYEEAKAYFLMGTIYRVCAVEDVSQMMFNSAEKIFTALGADHQAAEVFGNLGMLMTMQNRFEEADDFFGKALNLYLASHNLQGEAEILNQKALTALIQNNFLQAAAFSKQALCLHQKNNCSLGQALSLELSGNAQMGLGDLQKALFLSQKAQKLYQKVQNFSALADVLFLEAQLQKELGKDTDAEAILRNIIDLTKEHPVCFHKANAYSLLALIYLERGNLKRAKGLLQQSLDCELDNNRTDGIAIDYTNIALIEFRKGQKKQASETLAKALQYAETFGETDLSKKIREIINNKKVPS